MTYRSGVEVARDIRQVLKEHFPGVRFSVRSDHSAVNVRWTDGPTQSAVDNLVRPFASVRYDEYSGDILAGGNLFVFTSRDVSPELQRQVLARLRALYGRDIDPNGNSYEDSRLYHIALDETTGPMPDTAPKKTTTKQQDKPTAAPVGDSAAFWVTGAWSWLSFAEKPADAVLEALRAEGWRWSKKRAAWYSLEGKLPPQGIAYAEKTA